MSDCDSSDNEDVAIIDIKPSAQEDEKKRQVKDNKAKNSPLKKQASVIEEVPESIKYEIVLEGFDVKEKKMYIESL
jgi:hypothetical protein